MGESYYPACEDCRRSTGMNCGKHGHAYIIEGGSTLPLLAERQYAYDRIAALIADRDAALAERDHARAALQAVEWTSLDPFFIETPQCPWCLSYEKEGHTTDCQCQAALGVGRGEGE